MSTRPSWRRWHCTQRTAGTEFPRLGDRVLQIRPVTSPPLRAECDDTLPVGSAFPAAKEATSSMPSKPKHSWPSGERVSHTGDGSLRWSTEQALVTNRAGGSTLRRPQSAVEHSRSSHAVSASSICTSHAVSKSSSSMQTGNVATIEGRQILGDGRELTKPSANQRLLRATTLDARHSRHSSRSALPYRDDRSSVAPPNSRDSSMRRQAMSEHRPATVSSIVHSFDPLSTVSSHTESTQRIDGWHPVQTQKRPHLSTVGSRALRRGMVTNNPPRPISAKPTLAGFSWKRGSRTVTFQEKGVDSIDGLVGSPSAGPCPGTLSPTEPEMVDVCHIVRDGMGSALPERPSTVSVFESRNLQKTYGRRGRKAKVSKHSRTESLEWIESFGPEKDVQPWASAESPRCYDLF